ncbi:MAG: DNA-binding response regulator [Desulfovibrio sp.]|nr:MAG: DNA-binding response regulator [Desulfovibrio sp.]
MIRALVVDDEQPARDELCYLLAGYPDIQSVEAKNAGEALDHIRRGSVDLVFQDIQMPGKDGFHVLRESLLLPSPPLFVFITAYDQYAVRAFDENALDYLLKPVSEARLQVTIDRVRSHLRQRDEALGLSQRLQQVLAAVGKPLAVERIPVEKDGRVSLVSAEDICYCESQGRQIVVHLHGEAAPCHGVSSLDELSGRLQSLPLLKINRKTLVNVRRVREYSPWTGGRYCLVLDDDARTELTLSRGRVKEFKSMLGL